MIEVTESRFEEMVGDALDTLPPALTKVMRNVVVVVEDGRDPHLLGLYEGIPLTQRDHYSGVLPDRITLFRVPLCRHALDREDLVREVRVTVLHEFGHHVGLEEDRLHDLGWG